MCPGIELVKMETSAMIHLLPEIIIVALLLVNESVNAKNPTNPSDFSINSSIGNATSDASLSPPSKEENVLMVVEQEQKVKEDARVYAEQDAEQNYGAKAEAKEEVIPKPPPVGPIEKLRPVKLGLENRVQLSDGEWFVHGLEMICMEMATYQLGLASHAPYKVIIESILNCCCNSVFGKSDPQTEPVVKQMFLIATTRLKPDFEQQKVWAGMRFPIEWNDDDIGVTQVEIVSKIEDGEKKIAVPLLWVNAILEKKENGTMLLVDIRTRLKQCLVNKEVRVLWVKEVPLIFPSETDYLNLFTSLLLEETRAELHSQVTGIRNAPTSRVSEFRMSVSDVPGERFYNATLTKMSSYSPKGGDLIVLATLKLRCIDDLYLLNSPFLIAFVNRVVTRYLLKVQITSSRRIDLHPILIAKSSDAFVVYLTNLTINMRIWKALKPSRNTSIIQRTLSFRPLRYVCFILLYMLVYAQDYARNTDLGCSDGEKGVVNSNLRETFDSFKLNSSQEVAVFTCLDSNKGAHQESINLIWGPPGTEKTKTVASLFFLLLRTNHRTLTCAPTNIVVVGVVKRLLSLVRDHDLGYDAYGLGDIIIFGNEGPGMNSIEFVLIDEAAQLKECESIISFKLFGVCHAVLVGDERQLTTMVQSKICEEAKFGRSLFEILVLLGHEKHLLNIQYRMHPTISLFPNIEFYDGKLVDTPDVNETSRERCFLEGGMYGSYSFINVDLAKEEIDKNNSTKNMLEVAVITEIVANLFRESVAKKQKVTVGFQSSEEDVTIFLTVRCNYGGSVGFLASRERANVRLTRARHCLWIVGNKATMIKSSSVWTKLVLDVENRGCLYDASDYTNLANAMVHTLFELGHFGLLLKSNSILFKKAKWKIWNLIAPPLNYTYVPFGAIPRMCPGIKLVKMKTSAMIHLLHGIIIVALLLVNESVNAKNPKNPSDFSINSSIGNATSDASLSLQSKEENGCMA
uniref:Uncharacterized ATP-dependent helicase C29A10.10c-like n=1 Tax=Tanacetum cinerariifolium TaxID=118510 RepID=A0A6L2NMT6_TANCI|nr:uncharacterized ATP-dependent helicase C29A10.10c-like [Tanacetum cinerariifolium]